MAQRVLDKKPDVINEWISLAERRVGIPKNYLEVEYQKEADLLYIKLSNSPATYSDDDLNKGIVFDYDEHDNLVGIEVWNLYGVFAQV